MVLRLKIARRFRDSVSVNNKDVILKGKYLIIDTREVIIGSAKDADIRVDSGFYMDDKHFMIVTGAGGWNIYTLTRMENGVVLVPGGEKERWRPVHKGAHIPMREKDEISIKSPSVVLFEVVAI
tara:strand:+ start:282 stop:653 length:372 start_codon:yes stop_codon:yes gene_type:complete